MNRVELLKLTPFFSSLSVRAIEIIDQQAIEQTYEKGDYIFFEGDRSHSVFIILNGRVKLVKHSAEGKNVIIRMVTTGEMFGESAIFDRKPYPSSAQTMEKTLTLCIKRSDFYILMMKNPEIAIKLIGELGVRLRESYDMIQNLAAQNVQKRIASLLMKFIQRANDPAKNGIKFEFDLTRQDIADMTGTTVESAIRTMSRFRKSGLISMDGKRIVVLDFEGLQEIAEN